MYKEGTRLSRAQIPPMITDSNHACMAKMIGRRVQEGVFNKEHYELHLQSVMINLH